jgi:hypothetical protein
VPAIIQNEAFSPNGQNYDQSRFGRIYTPDIRDAEFPMERALKAMKRAELARRQQAPRKGATLDQIGPRCVKYSAATSLSAAPTHFTTNRDVSIQRVEVSLDGSKDLYDWAQAHDEWPGTNYEGTSVRAGQEYLRKIGLSSGYVWARTWDELVDYQSRVGSAPVILGIDWTADMDAPHLLKGAYYIEPTGPVLGGHAICSLWYDKKKDALKLQNTWGPGWGDNGVVYFHRSSAEPVIFMWNGEAASFTEKLAA